MTVLTRNPLNPNPLQPNKFLLTFGRAPNMQYFCQNVSVPGISLSEIIRNTPFVDIYSPGEKAIYDLLNVTFIIDEALISWLEIHDWIRGMTFPTRFGEYTNLSKLNKYASVESDISKTFPQFSDATLTIYNSSNNPFTNFHFHECFPVSLSTFVMNTQDDPGTILTADATFRYSYYDIIPQTSKQQLGSY